MFLEIRLAAFLSANVGRNKVISVRSKLMCFAFLFSYLVKQFRYVDKNRTAIWGWVSAIWGKCNLAGVLVSAIWVKCNLKLVNCNLGLSNSSILLSQWIKLFYFMLMTMLD